jgi:hypothetical protein
MGPGLVRKGPAAGGAPHQAWLALAAALDRQMRHDLSNRYLVEMGECGNSFH